MVDLALWRTGWGVFGVLALLGFGACGSPETGSDTGGPHFITTIPPFEMILSPLVEGRGSVGRLLEPGMSPHTYEPSPSAVRSVTNATALVYGARHMDGWAADLPAERRVALVDVLPTDVRRTFRDENSGTVDPHFWTDAQAVRRLLPALVDTLCAIDDAGCSTYRSNADSFATSLATLDARLDTTMRPVRAIPVFLAQPFFRYFLHRYGPHLVGVVEPNPGAEPTPRQLQAIVERARTSGARFILTQAQLPDRSARAVAEPAGLPIVRLDPLGGGEGRATLFELLLSNAKVLRDSLTRSDLPSGSARNIKQ